MGAAAMLCTRCVLPDSYPGIHFDAEGVCSVCREHARAWADWRERLPERQHVLEGLCADARRRGKEFDALIPLSGGKDSTYALWYAVKRLNLKCLAFTLDNGYLTAHARDNVDRACRALGVEHIYYCLDPNLVNALFALFMRKTGYFCSVCLRGIGMATEHVAAMYDVPLVFGGTSTRTELPVTADMFQAGPVAYVRNVLRGESLEKAAQRLLYPGSPKRRLGYRMFWWGSQKRVRVCAWVNLPDYVDWTYEDMYRTIRDELGWTSPAEEAEHTDCAIHPVTTYLHNRRFPGLEIRRLTFARLIMAGQMSRDEALRLLAEEPEPECPSELMQSFLATLGMTQAEFDHCVDQGPRHLAFRPQPSAAWQALRKAKRLAFRVAGIRRGT